MRGRSRRAGRAARKRRQKCESTVHSVSLCHQLQYVRLMKFLHQRGFTSTLLQPAHFTDTGRGLQTLRAIKPGQLIISLPESCLLTTSTVLSSYLGQHIKSDDNCAIKSFILQLVGLSLRVGGVSTCSDLLSEDFIVRFYFLQLYTQEHSWKPRLSPLLALCVFLVCEQHRGEASDWFPYINVLPATYTCPAYFTDDIITVLPAGVRRRALEQREAVREIHSSNQEFFRSLQPILSQPVEEVLTYEALRWAWCSVNTRSVFMSHPPNNFLCGQDVYALAPFLDLLNHQPDVQVKASFNEVTRCYEIRSVSGTLRYQQAFINYGSHDNQRLLLEYGFVAPGNPHSVVYVDTDLLCDVLRGDRSLNQKIKFLRENHLLHNLTVSSEGPSWRLMTALRLLSTSQTLYHQWKAVLLGQAVCEEREEWSIHTAQTLCQRLLQDTDAALDKISNLLQHCEQSVREQLDVVKSLRQEERCILGNCLEVLQGMIRQPDELSHQPDVDTVS